ncbi:unnamed protein product [Symbiodinium sp. CCMP2592]|nr:unnamed protein product [Symbiodinium sp. CCMP2592]
MSAALLRGDSCSGREKPAAKRVEKCRSKRRAMLTADDNFNLMCLCADAYQWPCSAQFLCCIHGDAEAGGSVLKSYGAVRIKTTWQVAWECKELAMAAWQAAGHPSSTEEFEGPGSVKNRAELFHGIYDVNAGGETRCRGHHTRWAAINVPGAALGLLLEGGDCRGIS